MGNTQSKQKENPFVILDNRWFRHKVQDKWVEGWLNEYTSWGLAIYCILQKNITLRNNLFFSLEYICDCLSVSSTNKTYKNEIKNIIEKMCVTKILNINKMIKDVKFEEMIMCNFNLPKDNFTIVYDYQMDKILNYKGKENKPKLFTLFSFIKKSINSNTECCYPSEKDIMNATYIKSNNTVERGKKVLMDLGLILYDNPGHRIFKDKKVRQSNDIYVVVDYKNIEKSKKILSNAVEKYRFELEEKDVKVRTGIEANKKRSIAMKEYHRRKREENKGDI